MVNITPDPVLAPNHLRIMLPPRVSGFRRLFFGAKDT